MDLNWSFGRRISPVKSALQSVGSLSMPKTLTSSGLTLSNTSRFEEKKVLRRLHEQDILTRIQATLNRLNQNDLIAREVFKFRAVSSKRTKKQKEN